MQVNRLKLISDLLLAMPGVETGRPSAQGSDTAVIRDGKIITFNSLVSVIVPAPELAGITAVVKAAKFLQILQKMVGETLEITVQGTVLMVSNETTEAEVAMLEDHLSAVVAEKLSVDPSAHNQIPLPEDFMDAVRLCRLTKSSYKYGGIFTQGALMYATDGTRSSRYQFDEGTAIPRFWLDDAGTAEMAKMANPTHVCVFAGWVMFTLKSGAVVSIRRMDASEYRDASIDAIMKISERKDSFVGNKLPAGLNAAIERASIFGQELDKTVLVLGLDIGQTKLKISGSSAGIGTVRESIKWETPFSTDPAVTIEVNAPFLQEASRKAMSFYVAEYTHMEKERRVLVFEDAKYRQVVGILIRKK